MLTYNDRTVENAYEIFDQCKNTKARYWGFKEAPLSLEEMKRLFAYMKSCGKSTALEVVDYTEEGCVEGAKKAVACGVDFLLGTIYSDAARDICLRENIRYMPFVGKVSGRPSVLNGTLEDMIEEAKGYAGKGVDGIDLLGYRYTGDPFMLNKVFVAAMNDIGVPVCIAGSVNSYKRLDELKEVKCAYYTIGSAFFEKKFGKSFAEQIDLVCDYMRLAKGEE